MKRQTGGSGEAEDTSLHEQHGRHSCEKSRDEHPGAELAESAINQKAEAAE